MPLTRGILGGLGNWGNVKKKGFAGCEGTKRPAGKGGLLLKTGKYDIVKELRCEGGKRRQFWTTRQLTEELWSHQSQCAIARDKTGPPSHRQKISHFNVHH